MGMFGDIKTPIKRYAGAAAAVTVPVGTKIICMAVHATTAGSITMWDQAGGSITIPVPAATWGSYQALHLNTVAANSGNNVITFTGTDSYFIEATNPTGF